MTTTHRIPEEMLRRRLRVVVVGCGGTGSAVAGALPYLHQSMLAFGHPHGMHVTLIDGDEVSPTNCVRQPFSQSEVGLNKAVVLATRLNLFWGLSWDANPSYLTEGGAAPDHADIVVGCVDSRRARAIISKRFAGRAHYWLDFGNEGTIGQYVLGEFHWAPAFGRRDERPRLPHVGDLHPELLDAELDRRDGPSCSALEALTRQAPFINQILANHGLALLSRLFRYGSIEHHGGWINLETGHVRGVPVPEPAPAPVEEKRARPKKRGVDGRARVRARA